MTDIPETQGDKGEVRQYSFYRRYRRIIGAAYAVLVSAAIVFFIYDVYRAIKAEQVIIQDRVRAHILILDALASGLIDRFEDLGANAALTFEEDARKHADQIIDLPQTSIHFNPDGGEAAPRARAFLPGFDRLARQLPMISRLIYLSPAEGISALPAGKPDRDALSAMSKNLTPALMRRFNSSGIRRPVWLPRSQYPSEHLAAAMPVHNRAGKITGILLLELSADYLKRVNSDLDYIQGNTTLLDQEKSILVGPPEISWEMAAPLPPRQVRQLDGRVIYWQAMEAAPWIMIYQADSRSLMARMAWQAAPKVGLLLVVMTLLMLVANHLTRHEFVDPATRLVRHIHRGGDSTDTDMSGLPPAWEPWFGTVSQIFRENADLARVRQELQLAREMQSSILPRQPLQSGGVEIHGYMEPAKEIGGDFYDYFELDGDRVGVVIADVSGKGVPAGLFMMVSRTLLKATMLAGVEPAACLKRVNDLLEEQNDMAAFVTVFLGVINLKNRTMTYANGGHNPPYILRRDGSIGKVDSFGDLVLGMMPDMDYMQAEAEFAPGDSLFLFTDGLTEAFDTDKQEYGEARLEECLAGQRGAPPLDIVRSCVASVKTFADSAEQSDDITCLAARFGGEDT